MSQSDNFFGGFLVGTLVGGVVGGVVGVVVASKLSGDNASAAGFDKLDAAKGKGTKQKLKASTEQNMEGARRGLEAKIAQLNDAIDDVRQQLGSANGTIRPEHGEETLASE